MIRLNDWKPIVRVSAVIRAEEKVLTNGSLGPACSWAAQIKLGLRMLHQKVSSFYSRLPSIRWTVLQGLKKMRRLDCESAYPNKTVSLPFWSLVTTIILSLLVHRIANGQEAPETEIYELEHYGTCKSVKRIPKSFNDERWVSREQVISVVNTMVEIYKAEWPIERKLIAEKFGAEVFAELTCGEDISGKTSILMERFDATSATFPAIKKWSLNFEKQTYLRISKSGNVQLRLQKTSTLPCVKLVDLRNRLGDPSFVSEPYRHSPVKHVSWFKIDPLITKMKWSISADLLDDGCIYDMGVSYTHSFGTNIKN